MNFEILESAFLADDGSRYICDDKRITERRFRSYGLSPLRLRDILTSGVVVATDLPSDALIHVCFWSESSLCIQVIVASFEFEPVPDGAMIPWVGPFRYRKVTFDDHAQVSDEILGGL